MNIQLITYRAISNPFGSLIEEVSTFENARVFDDFDISIIDLTDKSIWCNKYDRTDSISIINDFKSLGVLLNNSHKNSTVIILLPGNIQFHHGRSNNGYFHSTPLKDMLNELQNQIISNICSIPGKFIFGATSTQIEKSLIKSDFYFSNIMEKQIVTCTENGFVTSVCNDDKTIISTFLKIDNASKLEDFIAATGIAPDKKETQPEWFQNINMFDDEAQKQLIRDSKEIIAIQKGIINDANSQLQTNNKWKSVLYTQGDELVKTVYEMLEQMLEVNLSDFEDIKREDFNFQYKEKTVIGEIKGVSSGVKNAHVSQLINNVSIYKDNHPEDNNEKVSLLIINPQRKIAPWERESVQEDQINLAERNEALIIETFDFLKIFEMYRSGDLSRDECWDMISTNTGILKVEDEEGE